jgi:hypothetical protein
MTAYSTAVGPSSETIKFLTLLAKRIMVQPHLKLGTGKREPHKTLNLSIARNSS